MASLLDKAFAGRAFAVLSVCALLALAGCGDDSDQGSTETSVQPGSTSSSGATGSSADKDAGSDAGSSGSAEDGQSTSSDSGDGSQGGSSDAGFKAEPPPIQLYVNGTSDVNVSKPTVKIAKNQRQLDALIKSQASKSSDRPTVPVNFNEDRQAIALFMPKSPRGSQVTVTGVSSNGEKTRVEALMLVPTKGCKVDGPSNARPTAWVETRTLPGRDVTVIVTKSPLGGC